MKKSFLMICCMLATSFIFTGCEETEVKGSAEQFNSQEALKLLHEQFPLESENQNARTLAGRDMDKCILTATYEQGSTFELSAKIDLTNETNCPPNKSFTIRWYYLNGNDAVKVWKVWSTKTGTCLSHGNTHGPYGVNAKTTTVWFSARVIFQNSIWGETEPNSIVLTRPF